MKVESSRTYRFEFTDLEHGIKRPDERGLNQAILTRVLLEWTVYSDDDDGPFFNWTLRGYDCKANGTIDNRQKREGHVSYPRAVDMFTFLRQLALRIETDANTEEPVAGMVAEIENSIKRAEQRDKELLERLLSCS